MIVSLSLNTNQSLVIDVISINISVFWNILYILMIDCDKNSTEFVGTTSNMCLAKLLWVFLIFKFQFKKKISKFCSIIIYFWVRKQIGNEANFINQYRIEFMTWYKISAMATIGVL